MVYQHDLFTSVEGQVEIVRGWSDRFGWGFSESDFEVAMSNVPEWPCDRLTAVVLVPYLHDRLSMKAIEVTFWELCRVVLEEHRTRIPIDNLMQQRLPGLTWQETLHYQKDTGILPGLRFETIVLNANWDRLPRDSFGKFPANVGRGVVPSAGVLATAALHPKWVWAMDNRTVPSVLIPGYEVRGTVDPNLFLTLDYNLTEGVLIVDRQDATHRGNYSMGTKKAIPAFYKAK